jgi:hypothetical protein
MAKDWEFGARFLDDILDWIQDNLDPESVFGVDKLEKWAEERGWIQEEEDQE